MSNTREPPSLSVIIPAYNRPEDVRNLLRSLQPHMDRAEILVVDDCSPEPRIFDSVKESFPSVRFLRMNRNGGPGSARNHGAREATRDILLYLDSDTELVPGAIEAMMRFFQDNPNVQVCSGGICTEPINSGFFPKYKALLEASWVPSDDADVTFVAGRCFAIRRAAMLEIGGFNTDYDGADVEDFELGHRLRGRFRTIRFLRKLMVKHRYPSAGKQAQLYYRRVILWMDLKQAGSGFDNVGTTRKEAIITLLSAALPFVLMISIVTGRFLPGFALLALTIALNSNFLLRCLRDQGLIFAMRALACHSYLAIWITAGAGVAILTRGWTRRGVCQRATEI